MTNQKAVDWQAVANHLAIEVMGWEQKGERYALHRFWVDSNDNDRVLVVNWKPHKNWRHVGMIIDEMRGRELILDFWYSRSEDGVGYGATFFNRTLRQGIRRSNGSVGKETELKAIALAAALATGYVEQEKTEAEILLDKLFKEGLYCMQDTEERILELFEQSFERIREKEEQKQSVIIKDLRQIDIEENNAGLLLSRIRYRLLDKTEFCCLLLTPIEQIILSSIEEWMEER